MARTVQREKGEGQAIWLLNSLYEVKVSSDESDGAVTVMEMTIPPGWGPPPHTHPGSETVYVLDGRIRYHVGGHTLEGGPGSIFHVPEGTVEHFEPLDGTVRILVTYVPGGPDRFFAEAGEPAQSRQLPPPSDQPPDIERLVALGQQHGMRIQVPS